MKALHNNHSTTCFTWTEYYRQLRCHLWTDCCSCSAWPKIQYPHMHKRYDGHFMLSCTTYFPLHYVVSVFNCAQQFLPWLFTISMVTHFHRGYGVVYETELITFCTVISIFYEQHNSVGKFSLMLHIAGWLCTNKCKSPSPTLVDPEYPK